MLREDPHEALETGSARGIPRAQRLASVVEQADEDLLHHVPHDLARGGRPDEAAVAGMRVLDLLTEVQSSRVQTMLAGTARVLLPHRRASGVSTFLERHASLPKAV